MAAVCRISLCEIHTVNCVIYRYIFTFPTNVASFLWNTEHHGQCYSNRIQRLTPKQPGINGRNQICLDDIQQSTIWPTAQSMFHCPVMAFHNFYLKAISIFDLFGNVRFAIVIRCCWYCIRVFRWHKQFIFEPGKFSGEKLIIYLWNCDAISTNLLDTKMEEIWLNWEFGSMELQIHLKWTIFWRYSQHCQLIWYFSLIFFYIIPLTIQTIFHQIFIIFFSHVPNWFAYTHFFVFNLKQSLYHQRKATKRKPTQPLNMSKMLRCRWLPISRQWPNARVFRSARPFYVL